MKWRGGYRGRDLQLQLPARVAVCVGAGLCVRREIRAMREHRPYCPFPKTATQFDELTVLSSTLHFVLRLSVEGRAVPT